jgi:hypothetical protein
VAHSSGPSAACAVPFNSTQRCGSGQSLAHSVPPSSRTAALPASLALAAVPGEAAGGAKAMPARQLADSAATSSRACVEGLRAARVLKGYVEGLRGRVTGSACAVLSD